MDSEQTTPKSDPTTAAPASTLASIASPEHVSSVETVKAPSKTKKSHRLVGAIGLIIVITLVLAVVVKQPGSKSNSKTQKAANNFVAALTAKDYPRAYNYFSEPLKAKHSEAEFEKAFANAPFDSSCKLVIASETAVAGTGIATRKIIKGDIVCGSDKYPTQLDYASNDHINTYKVGPAK